MSSYNFGRAGYCDVTPPCSSGRAKPTGSGRDTRKASSDLRVFPVWSAASEYRWIAAPSWVLVVKGEAYACDREKAWTVPIPVPIRGQAHVDGPLGKDLPHTKGVGRFYCWAPIRLTIVASDAVGCTRYVASESKFRLPHPRVERRSQHTVAVRRPQQGSASQGGGLRSERIHRLAQ